MASTAVESVAAAIRIFRPSAKAIPVVGPIVEGVLESVLELYKHVELVKTNRKKAKELVERIGLLAYTIVMHSHLESLDHEGRERMASHLGVLERVLKDTNDCIKRLRTRAGRVANTLKHLAQPTSDDNELKRLNTQLDQAIQRFHLGTTLETVSNTFRDRSKEKRATELSYLREILQPVHEALYDSHTAPPGCLDGTRKDVLDIIFNWAFSDSDQRVFWLSGMAGTGKSTGTIAKSVCERIAEHLDSTHFDDPDVHLVTFFISHNTTDRRSPFRMLRTLVFYLCRAIPSFRTSLHDALTSTPELVHKTMKAQLQSLLAVPLSSCAESKPKIILVIDAFDECDEIDGHEGGDLLPTLLSIISQSELSIRLIFTSRNEQSIHDMFAPCREERTLRLHEIERGTVDNDIRAYLAHELDGGGSSPAQIDSAQLDSLVGAAGGLFVYAATVARYLKSMTLFDRAVLITTILERPTSSPASVDSTPLPDYTLLDGMYGRILLEALPAGANEPNRLIAAKVVYSVVASLALVEDQVSPQTLAALIGRDLRQVTTILMSLASVLTFESSTKPIRFLHASFYEFVLDPKRIGARFPGVDVSDSSGHGLRHAALARGCFSILNSRLREDLCGIGDPCFLRIKLGGTDRIASCIPDELAHACKHWGAYLRAFAAQSSLPDAVLKDINTDLAQFCHSHLLHWVEALCLLQSDGAVCGTLGLILQSTRWARKETMSMSPVYAAMREVYEIVYRHRHAIAVAPLHIYTIAQIFGSRDRLPPTGLTHIQCLTQPRRIWSSKLRSPGKPADYVIQVAVSLDGSYLVSIGRYINVPFGSTSEVGLLHLESGYPFSLPAQPYATRHDTCESLSWSSCTAISRCGTFIAYDVSGQHYSDILLWTLGSDYLSVSCRVNGWVSAFMFSEDAACLYAVVLETGCYPAKLSCRRFSLQSGILSEDARVVLHSLGDADEYWPNPAPAPNLYCCEDWMRQACCHAPRPSDFHKSLRVRMTATIRGITVAIAGTAWSDIRVWHLSSESALSCIVLRGHTRPVRDIALSNLPGEDNKHLLASCSDNDGVILWDVLSGCRIATFLPALHHVTSCALSSDGALLAVGGSGIEITDRDVETSSLTLWETRAPQCILRRYTSPDRRYWENSAKVALLPPHGSSSESRLLVWDGTNGFKIHSLSPDSTSLWGRRFVQSAVFSSDGRIFATVIPAGTGIDIWKTSDGTLLHSLQLHAAIGNQFQQLELFEVSLLADDHSIAVFAHCRVKGNYGFYKLRSRRQISGGWTTDYQHLHGLEINHPLDAVSLSSSWDILAHTDRTLPEDSNPNRETQVVTVRELCDGGNRVRHLWSILVGNRYCETTRIQLSPDGRILAVLWPVPSPDDSRDYSIRLWLVGQASDQPYRIVSLVNLCSEHTGCRDWRFGFSGNNTQIWCCNFWNHAYVVYDIESSTEMGDGARSETTFGYSYDAYGGLQWLTYTSPAHPQNRRIFCIGDRDVLPLAWFEKTVVIGPCRGELIVLRVDEESLSLVPVGIMTITEARKRKLGFPFTTQPPHPPK